MLLPVKRPLSMWAGSKPGRWLRLGLVVLAALLAGLPAAAAAASPAAPLLIEPAGLNPADGLPQFSSADVHICRLEGAVDLGMAKYLSRAANTAAADGAALLIMLDSTGGRVDAALAMRDVLLRTGAATIVLVDGRAWSAAALVASAAEVLFMAPGASIGAAEPDPLTAKTLSALRAEFEATAEARGRNPLLAAAMVDAQIELPGLVKRGRLLSMTAGVSAAEGYADGIARSTDEALALVGLAAAARQENPINAAERAASFVTNPAVAPVLLTIAFVALVIEVFSAGFGAAGVIGLASLGLFFGGHLIAGFGGWEVAALFVLGLILLMVEVFVPGFGIFGLGGIASMIGSIYLASRGSGDALRSLAIAIVASLVLSLLLLRLGIRRGLFARLSLGTRMLTEQGYVGREVLAGLVGRSGVAETMLRPVGTARIDGSLVEVVSEGMYVAAGTAIVVSRIDGSRVIVRPAATPVQPTTAK